MPDRTLPDRRGLQDADDPRVARTTGVAEVARVPRMAGVVRRGTIHLDGRRWILALDGHRVRVADLVGMRYLAELLTRPGQSIPALTLASRGLVRRSSNRHEVLDEEARAAYQARAEELTSDLAEAEANNDLVRAERFRLELDALVDELASATGLGGRSRAFTDPAERARSSVSKAIRRAVDVVDDASPALADVLRGTIQCGTVCSYVPDAKAPISWSTQPPDGAAPVGPVGSVAPVDPVPPDAIGGEHDRACSCPGGPLVFHIVISVGVTKGLW